ncbi:MAG: zinc ribbon domain-containing protein [Fimbriimonadaceae bacterium]|nr:zinc ribbon domain-containing protein [Fimbriimonadaceae bacterium]QYK56210.1 MAG: zinc ribbon domain-containing protein [Fimbriimonadaceae bacterium]
MPLYEFRCGGCGRKVTLLVGVVASDGADCCPHCGSADLTKLVSRFRRGRSEDDRVDELADRVELMGEPDSSSGMRSLVREMGKAMDDDMADEMEELFETDMEEGGDD